MYDPTQPHFLRMNYATENINAWHGMSNYGGSRPSLLDWLAKHYPALAEPNGFVPRAIAGRYLSHCYDLIIESLPSGVSVRLVPESVKNVTPDHAGWRIESVSEHLTVDEVIVTTGHQGWLPPEASGQTPTSKQIIDRIFPVSDRLSLEKIHPRSTVAVRGFALTWIDATLALTAGRGGRFLPHDGMLEYVPSGLEPGRILPFSRTGRPLLSKPERDRMETKPGASAIWAKFRGDILELAQPEEGLDFTKSIWPIVLAASDALTGDRCSEEWFRKWCSSPFDGERARKAMLDSYRVATGQQQADEAFALAEAWRNLYPAIVERVSHGGLAVTAWDRFHRIAAEMERIAFGPPAVNMARMLALIEAGIVDLRYVSNAASMDADTLIHATIPPPTQLDPDGPLARLLDNGHITADPGSGGIQIDHNGYAASHLSVLGRATEGWVLGNDTLSRELHPQMENWARTLANRVSN